MGTLPRFFSGIFFSVIFCLAFTASVSAGNLEPAAAPAPTMKTLDQIPPTWDQLLASTQRFVVVMGGAAVLDKETGLVWQRASVNEGTSWETAYELCLSDTTGGRMGWRLPRFEELLSLRDPTVHGGHGAPALPSGHPFNIHTGAGHFWTATAYTHNPTWAYSSDFEDVVTTRVEDKVDLNFRWCVRGGAGSDFQ